MYKKVNLLIKIIPALKRTMNRKNANSKSSKFNLFNSWKKSLIFQMCSDSFFNLLGIIFSCVIALSTVFDRELTTVDKDTE